MDVRPWSPQKTIYRRAQNGNRVNAIAPGTVYTPLHRDTPKDVMDSLSPMGWPRRSRTSRMRSCTCRCRDGHGSHPLRRWRRSFWPLVTERSFVMSTNSTTGEDHWVSAAGGANDYARRRRRRHRTAHRAGWTAMPLSAFQEKIRAALIVEVARQKVIASQ